MPSSTDDKDRASEAGRDAAALPRETPARETSRREAPGYETRDANTRGVLGFLVVLFVVINVVLFGTWRLFRYYSVAGQAPVPASSFADERQVSPAPDLEVNGREDFRRYMPNSSRNSRPTRGRTAKPVSCAFRSNERWTYCSKRGSR